QPVRISTELVQIDVVVTDKQGRVVKGLTKDDFELYENGKKQLVSFFEMVDAVKGGRAGQKPSVDPEHVPSAQGPGETDIRRIFAFIIDDLEIRRTDMVFVRQMLTNFVETQMQPTDLVAIVRTVGGKGLLQQFTSDKELLRRAIAALTPMTHPLNAFEAGGSGAGAPIAPAGGGDGGGDISGAESDTDNMLRAYMSLGTASYVIDSLKQLPGRKAMILVSSGLPILSTNSGNSTDSISSFLNSLTDKAARAGVAINTMDIRGMKAHSGVADFEDTPGVSSTGTGGGRGFGRGPDESQFGYRAPFDTIQAQQGLRTLAADTGGIAVLNRNDFNAGLAQIVSSSEAYYLLAYTPLDSRFKGDFRKVEVRAKNKDYRVYSRRGYLAREDRPPAAPATKQEQVLQAIKSPVARLDIDLEATVLYKAATPDRGAIDIGLLIDPRKLTFEEVNGKQQANYDVVGFVYDELGRLRGGFSQTITATLTPEQLAEAVREGGLPYSTTTTLRAGVYQIRLAVRDNKTATVGSVSRYLEVPNLTRAGFTASSLLLSAAPPGEVKGMPTALSAARRVSRKQDLRYGVVIYNPKLKDGRPQVQTQIVISQEGRVIYKEPEQAVKPGSNPAQLFKYGQLGMAHVKPGRYTMTLRISDRLADKKTPSLARSRDFVVVD
ncbi:MAG TPA: VWA domain-containing protein, partial [Blastocatellia bacterium]|nr:VWA domain-containing protein [Blastocatellia bacterium]